MIANLRYVIDIGIDISPTGHTGKLKLGVLWGWTVGDSRIGSLGGWWGGVRS